MSTAIEVVDVSKRFRMYKERNQSLKASLMRGRRAKYDEFWALRDVGFEIPEGTTFGLIGENGSGKSTLLKCLARILVPDTGNVRVNGSMAALLELGSGFHPELTGRENVFLNGSILGLGKKDIESRFEEIVDFAGIEQFIDQPVKNYSSGMYVRLGFSVAINVDPDILLVDEVLAVGDASFQAKCMEKFADFRTAGKTVVIVSHAMGSMRTMCDHAAWLEHGRLVASGPATDLVDSYIDKTHTDRPVEEAVHETGRHGSGEITVERVELLDAPTSPSRRSAPERRCRSACTTVPTRRSSDRSSALPSRRSRAPTSGRTTPGTAVWTSPASRVTDSSTAPCRGSRCSRARST